jgi:GWxTD domain-containing protein
MRDAAGGAGGAVAGTDLGAVSAALNDASGAGGPDLVRAGLPFNVLNVVRELIETQSFALPAGVTGAKDLNRADSLFREAYAIDPTYAPASRFVAMVLAERGNWSELEKIARAHVTANPDDAVAWMTLGLAMHRLSSRGNAAAVFDTAMMKFDEPERRRLSDPARVVASSRTRAVRVAGIAERALLSHVFWMNAEPLWIDGTAELRSEFRARVAFAELRWTVDELGIRGADTDRGDVYVRYGPPDIIAVMGPSLSDNAADLMTFWLYRSGLLFAFSGMSGFGTARVPMQDRALFAGMKDAQPMRMDNLPVVRPDSMLVNLARFRARADSVDLYIAAIPPVARIRSSMKDTAGRVRTDLWFLANTGLMAIHDSTFADAPAIQQWIPRIEGGRTYLFRVEATGAGATRSARASTEIDVLRKFETRGPGISDVLLSLGVDSPPGTPTGWRDFKITPTVGAVVAGGTVSLLWENYDFSAADGMSKYEVVVTLTRTRSGAGALTASVLGALASVARVETAPDKVVVRYSRNAAASPVLVDNVSILLNSSPAGTYGLTLEVMDKVSGRSFTSKADLVVK